MADQIRVNIKHRVNNAAIKREQRNGRDVIVVPDRDQAGMRLVDRAMALNWSVSMPEWPPGCKDVNDAVRLMGRVAVLSQIMRSRESSRLKIQLRQRAWFKHILSGTAS